ncbi:1-acyl-sn-glycerol-3-phosphate acyltransferase [Wolbachia endosymbiont of Cruorifilaria tuberocauda]|uniref:lysophospholipid acyltransferase family protein n=1 Tax=Wolbachia endosymbiont of Cruorifilaria tuberocauda TaxID=1812111 RepID=UPI00158D92E6|nr:lysophospholipid acyltransferase family protein [Wolbachia endosymbiont of Cruorifilaria tuberocauda]QKX01761.1 1-acyl-sn-glycerol-3-phosphate acyltransferase [Wolbachia endosymbiont of Cruorifilaria tuberocauda]
MISSLLFSFFLILWEVIYTLATIPILLFPTHIVAISLAFSIKVILYMLRLLCGIKYEIRGMENIPKQPFIVASKHQSPFETFIFMLLFKNAVFILKRELRWIPFVGLYLMALDMIFINRLDSIGSIQNIIKLARIRIKENRSIIIFPEGTRTIVGQKVKYRSGVAALYSILSIPVLPVALNTGFFWPKSIFSIRKNPGKAIIKILSPIYPGLSKGKFLKNLQKTIEGESSKLIAKKTCIVN